MYLLSCHPLEPPLRVGAVNTHAVKWRQRRCRAGLGGALGWGALKTSAPICLGWTLSAGDISVSLGPILGLGREQRFVQHLQKGWLKPQATSALQLSTEHLSPPCPGNIPGVSLTLRSLFHS